MSEKSCGEAGNLGRIGLPALWIQPGRLWYVKSTAEREFIAHQLVPIPAQFRYQVGLIWSNSGGTQAAKEKGGGFLVKSRKTCKPNSRQPRMVSLGSLEWKVADMARWMTRRIQRSRARCQKATAPKESKSPQQHVEHSEREADRTEGSATPIERS